MRQLAIIGSRFLLFVVFTGLFSGCGIDLLLGDFDPSSTTYGGSYDFDYDFDYNYNDKPTFTKSSETISAPTNKEFDTSIDSHYVFDADVPAPYDGVKLLNLAFNLVAESATESKPVARPSADGRRIFVDASAIGFGTREARLLNRKSVSEGIRPFVTRMFSATTYYDLTNTPRSRLLFRDRVAPAGSVGALGAQRLFGLMLLVEDSGVSEAPREIRVEPGISGLIYTSLDRDINKFRQSPKQGRLSRDPSHEPLTALHDGEEVLRIMKNGLIHFSLWDTNKLERIDIAPKSIAHDRSGMSRDGEGSLISNPLSCLDCHGRSGFQAHEWSGTDLPESMVNPSVIVQARIASVFKGVEAYQDTASRSNRQVADAVSRANAAELYEISDFIKSL